MRGGRIENLASVSIVFPARVIAMSSANDFKQAKANGRVERIREEAKAKAEAERKRKQPREKGGFNYDLYEVNTANELVQRCPEAAEFLR